MSGTPSYNVVVFAHNEARRISRCLESILAQASEGLQYIFVLVNGCTDDTADVLTRLSANRPEVIGVWLDRADKAASWNHYVQTLSADADSHAFNCLVRYQVREHQLKLLFHYMQDKQPSQMPGEITALYSELAHLIRYQYRGRNTPIDMLAIRYIKNHS